jgi:hypothetical protein
MKLTHIYICDDDMEADAFFDESDRLLAAWCLNDAHWRNEYMNSLLHALGHSVEKKYEMNAKQAKQVKEYFGF